MNSPASGETPLLDGAILPMRCAAFAVTAFFAHPLESRPGVGGGHSRPGLAASRGERPWDGNSSFKRPTENSLSPQERPLPPSQTARPGRGHRCSCRRSRRAGPLPGTCRARSHFNPMLRGGGHSSAIVDLGWQPSDDLQSRAFSCKLEHPGQPTDSAAQHREARTI
jgi:hypothetical protein